LDRPFFLIPQISQIRFCCPFIGKQVRKRVFSHQDTKAPRKAVEMTSFLGVLVANFDFYDKCTYKLLKRRWGR